MFLGVVNLHAGSASVLLCCLRGAHPHVASASAAEVLATGIPTVPVTAMISSLVAWVGASTWESCGGRWCRLLRMSEMAVRMAPTTAVCLGMSATLQDAILTTPTTTHAGASASGAEAGASPSPRINNPLLLDFSVEVELPAFRLPRAGLLAYAFGYHGLGLHSPAAGWPLSGRLSATTALGFTRLPRAGL
jgi:hypothetical protein